MKLVVPSVIATLLSVPLSTSAASSSAPQSGTYVTQGGWGQLKVERAHRGDFAFALSSTSPNGRMCELQGKAHEGRAILAVEGETASCRLHFTQSAGNAMRINAATEQCFSFCGMGATFEGDYLALTPECTNAGLAQSRKAFMLAYKGKDFPAARAILEPAINACSVFMPEAEKGRLANDLAVTLHHLGDDAGCMKVLAPFSGLARQSDDAIRSENPPGQAEDLVQLARPTRTNIKLCSSIKGKA